QPGSPSAAPRAAPPSGCNPEPNEEKAKKFKWSRKFEEAFTNFKIAYDHCKKPWLLVELGRAKEDLNIYDQALSYYQAFLSLRPSPDESDKKLARKRIMETCNKAVIHYSNLKLTPNAITNPLNTIPAITTINANCSDTRLSFAYGQVLYLSGKYREAID